MSVDLTAGDPLPLSPDTGAATGDSSSVPSLVSPTSAASSAAATAEAQAAQAAIDAQVVEILITYLRHACPPLLHATIPTFTSALNSLEAHNTLLSFVSDPSTYTLVVHKRINKPPPSTTATDTEQTEIYELELNAEQHSAPTSAGTDKKVSASVAFIKAVTSFDPASPIASQLYVCSLQQPAMFETMLSYVRHLFLPFSRSIATQSIEEAEAKKQQSSSGSGGTGSSASNADGAAGTSNAAGASSAATDVALYRGVARKLGELEVELLRFQESIDIPFITLDLHPAISSFLQKAKAQGKPARIEDFGDLASDATFLNEIQRGLNEWKKAILRVTRLTRDVNSGTVMQEVNFWLAFERAVLHIYEQYHSPGVELTFSLLKQNKRFLATTGFMQDVGMSEEGKDKDRVIRYAAFLRDLPIKRLLAATDLYEVNKALDVIFHHLKQIKRVDYPLSRFIALLQALSRDLLHQIQSILHTHHLMSIPYNEFLILVNPIDEVFNNWAHKITELQDIIRSIHRKKPHESIVKLNEPYLELHAFKQRMYEIKKIRKEQEELKTVISDTLHHDPYVRNTTLDAIHHAFLHLQREHMDILSITNEGQLSYTHALSLYHVEIDHVESELESKIREFLDAAKDDANEMFRVCARFNALFIRPRIQSAIREYQEQLINTVKKDILLLQQQYHNQAAKHEARLMSAFHDLPPVSATILWAKQIERQLDLYMQRVENVLGKQWYHHIEGRQLKRDSDDFRAKLKPHKLYTTWLAEKQEQLSQFTLKGSIYTIHMQGNALSLQVNFDRRLIVLFKEVRALSRLNMKMPFDVLTTADEARQNYPFAMRLEEVIRIYLRTCQRIDPPHTQLSWLAAGLKKAMQDSLSKGIPLQWLDTQVKTYVDGLGAQAIEFQDQVEELSSWVEQANTILHSMSTITIAQSSHTQLKAQLHELQTIINHLDKRGYTNLQKYVAYLDAQVERIMIRRLTALITAFTQAAQYDRHTAGTGASKLTSSEDRESKEKAQFDRDAGHRNDVDDDEDADDDSETNKDGVDADPLLQSLRSFPPGHFSTLIFTDPLKHDILIRNQVLIVEPPLEKARLSLTRAFHTWVSLVCDLPRLRLHDALITSQLLEKEHAHDSNYAHALSLISPALIEQCFSATESQLSAAALYVDTWLQYQALWDMDIEAVVNELGTDLHLWEQLLLDMKRTRANFDNNDQRRSFGPILVEYAAVQTKVNNKYDQWHKLILTRFGQILADLLLSLYTSLRQAREQLEKHSFDFTSTSDIVESVTLLQRLKAQTPVWEQHLKQTQSVENLLTRQRYHFASDWLFSDRVEGEWLAYQQILQRKMNRMAEEAANIQQKIGLEEQEMDKRIKDYLNEWKKVRPVKGDLPHKEVSTILNVADATLSKLESELSRLTDAKKALDMPIKEDTRLVPIREELSGLNTVWSHLSVIWLELDALADRYFKDIKPSELRKQLTRLQGDVQKLPNAMRSYEAYEHLRNTIKQYLTMNASLVELHSGVLRAKHEKLILKELGLSHILWNELTVAMLWSIDLKKHHKALLGILSAAQGESALEEFLNELREQWESTRLEMIDYRGKLYLIRNWDALFSQLTDRLSDLSSMKQSPYFKAFEREAQIWESKLNAAQSILDVFIEVQRKWIYLEAIFTNSLDVQQQLAGQYKKFKAFDREFVRLMRDIQKDPVLDVWVKEERQLQQELDAYADTLANIQKALGEYLERQRAAFPRFYFVGDEDLLEMIGNAKQPTKILRHLNKMFAGIEALQVSEDQKVISGMVSKEGEVVPFQQVIEVQENMSVHTWLTQVQYQMRYTLAVLLQQSITTMNELEQQPIATGGKATNYVESFFHWIDRYPAQIVLLSHQVQFSAQVDAALSAAATAKIDPLSAVLQKIESNLEMLADRILLPTLTPDCRKKYEQLITEKVHQRDSVRQLIQAKVRSADSFEWLGQMRYYYKPFTGKPVGMTANTDLQTLTRLSTSRVEPPELQVLEVRISRAVFHYGFEYLGVGERLVQTPLTDRCYLTLCESLHMRLGGNPFGPAGTGKTETVKALGAQLGRFVLVFNCDESFDFQAMGRIFVGLCQCGAWGCFDEFNRLEERILSAVSQQILTIQQGLKEGQPSISLLGKEVHLDRRVGLFVTMNPGYAGRSNLPDNLKQLFRSIAMIQPDRLLIAQVMLYSQGFRSAEELSGKVVLLFTLCSDQLSARSHYDFGLRALKSVLRSAGGLKRHSIQGKDEEAATGSMSRQEEEKTKDAEERKSKGEQDTRVAAASPKPSLTPFQKEQALLVRSIISTVVPKLVSNDVTLFGTLVRAVFPGTATDLPTIARLREAIAVVCEEQGYVDSGLWVDKLMQLHEISALHHGVIMVGPSGTGKSSAWNVLKQAIERIENTKIHTYVIDPKALSKQELFGVLDDVTLEFTDGIFTAILRKIIDNVRGEMSRQHWIIFDGDVDPEWAENLNSVLDDNKLLTLPNGDRLQLTNNVRIMFEVQNLNYATPATVSRCGMVWFSKDVLNVRMIIRNLLTKLKHEPMNHANIKPSVYARWRSVQERCAEIIGTLIGFTTVTKRATTTTTAPTAAAPPTSPTPATTTTAGGKAEQPDAHNFVLAALDWCSQQPHIMPLSPTRALMALFSLFKGAIAKVIEYDDNHADFPLSDKQLEAYLSRFLLFALLWAFGGSLSLANRLRFCDELLTTAPPSLPLPAKKTIPLLDWEVRVATQDWEQWEERVEVVELDAHKVIRADVVVDTVDTARHTDVISSWVADHRPLILCGPPGSGKSMTLTAVLRSLPEFELVTLNFSSTTTPKLLLDTLNHHCKVERTPAGLVMHPISPNKWLVLFCDEINLPANDAYHTQHVITFLRQLAEHGGFWRAADMSFVRVDRVQILGACNPPTDAGRVALSPRFLRHCPLVFVDFPAHPSLRQIYGTFNRALLKLVPSLRAFADSLTDAMIEVYSRSQARFTPEIQPHYIYSPRELSRWVRALYEAMKPPGEGNGGGAGGGGGAVGHTMSVTDLVRLWAHEALRLFQDRLVDTTERQWTDLCVNQVAHKFFPNVDLDRALHRPILFSNWLTRHYASVGQEPLREHVKTRLRVFNEEELDVKLVIFDEVLEHILRIDRVLRQPLGHLLLVGTSGAGKTILSKFVAWMNGMSVFQIKVHKYYTAKDFDKDLRQVLLRSGCHDENICFIFDESNVLNTAFLERMNALLAGGEVPGLFEGADYTALMAECKESARQQNLLLDNDEELYRHFISQVQRRLHVVFTMNPANEDFDNRSATSPALFNRCVIDWFGEWSARALYQVGYEFTKNLDLGDGIIIEQHDVAAEEEEHNRLQDHHHQHHGSYGSSTSFRRAATTERDAVVRTLVYVHQSVQKANDHLAAAANGRSSYVTPRHYLDFLKHYSTLFQAKRSALEEQQRHLNTGLRKLRETQEEVSKLQQALREKDVTLRANQKLANDKLEQMLADKREAESKRDVSLKIAQDIATQAAEIQQRQSTVESELATAKPALDEAESAVRNIKKADLDQVSRFPNPPAPVKLALEAVVLMLGEKTKDWEEIRKVLRRSDFIKSVINYDITALNKKIREEIVNKYIPDPNFAYEVVYNASKACGPLVQWVGSTVNFSRIKNSVLPLEEEMKALQSKQSEMEVKQAELTVIQQELQVRIDQYKQEYSVLIGEVERIKAEMSGVQVKVDRSMSLLTNLTSERIRWQQDSDSFQTQLSTVVGDCLLSAAFLAYIGYFNQTYRGLLLETWADQLHTMKVSTKLDLSLIEYLSHPSERLEWYSHALPVDDLCVENAIMMKHFNRYPLLIDPSGQATEFLMKQYKQQKIIRTSFLDDAFLKHLESALRFGNALLVEDVESIDPILNSVLNKEISKTGGRVMITLGDKEIDFSPSFTIFLSTRDPSCHFTPDLCSRVTLVNFTVTHSSLTAQCLNKILSAERKDIDEKRHDLLRLQGEFRVRLRELEESVLTALAAQTGNILDDETVMVSLETLKNQAEEVTHKMNDSEQVMTDITAIGNQYRPFALACSSIYFALEKMGDIHFLYQFSLPFFLRIVDHVLAPPTTNTHQPASLKEATEKMQRLSLLSQYLITESYARVSRGLLNQDQSAFALRLIQIALQEAQLHARQSVDAQEMEFFMKGTVSVIGTAAHVRRKSSSRAKPVEITDTQLPKVPTTMNLSRAQKLLLSALLRIPLFANLVDHINNNTAAWMRYQTAVDDSVESAQAHEADRWAPTGWEAVNVSSQPKHIQLFHQMCIAKVIRPDRVPILTQAFIATLFGPALLPSTAPVDLLTIVTEEVTAATPLLLVSRPGFDASNKVDALAASVTQQKYLSFAMGSPEGYEQADAAISTAVKNGTWILLKNVHLSPSWLTQLEKRLHRMHYHPNFRLFLTMELNPAVPVNLLRLSNILIFEPPVGVKASMLRMFATLPADRVNRAPAERSRLYFLLCWLHALILERVRYTPIGWAKAFEFSETDAACAMDAIDEWMDRVSAGRANISPDKIPWEALRRTLESVIYGGRIDNDFDQLRLSAFISALFNPAAYSADFSLSAGINIPDAVGYQQFRDWIAGMDIESSPTMLGLPSNAEMMLLSTQAEHIAHEWLQLQDQHREVEVAGIGNFLTEAMNEDEETQQLIDTVDAAQQLEKQQYANTPEQPAWMIPVTQQVHIWLKQLPSRQQLQQANLLAKLQASKQHTQMQSLVENPLFRCIQREQLIYASLLDTVLSDLEACRDVSAGVLKPNHRVREIMNEMRRNVLPNSWKKSYSTVSSLSAQLWMDDFQHRLQQIISLSSLQPAAYHSTVIWLGGLTAPEAFIAATRQYTATQQQQPLEQLTLKVTIYTEKEGTPAMTQTAENNCSFTFQGLSLHCSSFVDGHLAIHSNDPLSVSLPYTRFTWVLPSASVAGPSTVTIPVYQDRSRAKLLFSVRLPYQEPAEQKAASSVPGAVFVNRGTCLTVWNDAA